MRNVCAAEARERRREGHSALARALFLWTAEDAMGLPARADESERRTGAGPRPSPVGATTLRAVPPPTPELLFQTLVSSGRKRAPGSSWTRAASLVVHGALIGALVLLPVLLDDTLPDPDRTVRAFFVSPSAVAPPPPPPPPPAAGARKAASAPVVPRPAEAPRFVAPVEVPEEIVGDSGLDLGLDGGVEGGVEGGVPGGVVGGIVGGLPSEAPPPPPAEFVRVGGQVKAPKLVQRVAPEYPMLAQQGRVQGVVVLDAKVGPDGRVASVHVLQGNPLLTDAAVAAVRQWRYQPLLLNGMPTAFVLNVTVSFSFAPSRAGL